MDLNGESGTTRRDGARRRRQQRYKLPQESNRQRARPAGDKDQPRVSTRGQRRRQLGLKRMKIAAGEHQAHLMKLYGEDTTDTDPAEILLQEIRRTAGHIDWLREQIKLSDPETFVHSLWLVRRQSGYINPREIDMKSFSDAGALWVDLYLQERRHLAQICRTALAAGIEERRVRLAERQAENLGRAVMGMLFDLGLDPESDEVRAVVYRWLVAASTGQVPDQARTALLPIEPPEAP